MSRIRRPALSICALALLGCAPDAAPADPAPGPLWVFTAAEPAGIDDGRASALLLDGLGVEGQRRLTAELGEMATRLEARHHPLVLDLIGGDLEADAEAMLRRWSPARTAARALARGRWASDRGAVHLAAQCPPDARCAPLSAGPTAAPLAAWPIAHARRLRFDTPAAADRAAAALRAWVGRADSPLALVLTGDPPAGPPAEAAGYVARIVRRLPDGDRLRRLVGELAAPRVTERPIWWPERDEVMVVPRLAALADGPRINAAIAAATAAPGPRARAGR